MNRSVRSVFVIMLAATLGLVAFGSTSALAGSSFTDPAGDSGDAPDITAVTVSNDNGGNILVHVALANFTPESTVTIWLDTDKNASTGQDGFEYRLILNNSADAAKAGWSLDQWNGTAWVPAAQTSTVHAAFDTTYADFRINKSDLGGTSGFSFQVWTAKLVADAITAHDYAPDSTLLTWAYNLTGTPPQPTPKPATSPVVKALTSSGRLGTYIHLNFRISDQSGRATVSVGVYRPNGQRLAFKTYPNQRVSSGTPYWALWKPPYRGRFGFCVIAKNASGKISKPSCANATVS